MRPRIPLSSPHMAPDVLQELEQVIASNWIAHVGPSVDAFESELAACVGAAGCCATQSGTAALHLALRLLGVQPDDTVLCSALTFVATATPILFLGARPVFVDADASGSMSVRALERALRTHGARIRCIVVAHLYGQPADLSAILALADRYGVPVVEDAAQALGSTYRGRSVGTVGRVGVYSFAGNKVITTSTGGALVSNDAALVDRARWLAQQARADTLHYQHNELGYNYRLSNVLAAIGRSQLRVLAAHVAARRAVFRRYREALADLREVSWLPDADYGESSRWLSVMRLDPASGCDPRTLIATLARRGIEARHVFKPLHRQPLFGAAPFYADGDVAISDLLFERGICLPSSSNLSEADQEEVIAAVRLALPCAARARPMSAR